MTHRLVFLLLMLPNVWGDSPLNFRGYGNLYEAERFFHLEVDLGIDKVKSLRGKILNLDRLAVNITGRCQFHPLESSDDALSRTKTEKLDKHYTLLKDFVSNSDSLLMNDIQNSIEILGADISFPDEGENPIKGILAEVRAKREVTPDTKYIEFRNHKRFATSTTLNRYGKDIVAQEEIALLYLSQILKFNPKYTDFKHSLRTLNLSNNRDEVCGLMLRELDSLSYWGKLILKDFERVIRAIAHGNIPNKFFTDDFITSLQTKLDTTNDFHTIESSEVNKHDFVVKIEENLMYLTIFIPLYTETFDLYKFSGNLPLMRIHDSTYSVKLDPIVKEMYLAIGSGNSNRFILSPDQLSECLKVEEKLYCPPFSKFKSFEFSKNECLTNLWDTNNHLILETCNINIKKIGNYFEEIMPNCLQINLEDKAQITTIVPEGETGSNEFVKKRQDWEGGLHTFELSEKSYLVDASFLSQYFDSTEGNQKFCSSINQKKIDEYWEPYRETLSQIDDKAIKAAKNLYIPLPLGKSTNNEYLETHLYSIYSHIHILIAIIIFTAVKWMFVKLINCMTTKYSHNYELSRFKGNNPNNPIESAGFYPAPPPF